ncbi:MAG: DUF6356 family protein [Pseudomonadota bacterium]
MKLFTEHPHSVGETYGEHFQVATRFGGKLVAAGVCSIVHGFFPWMFETTGSRTVKTLYHQITGRGPAQHGAGDWKGAGV